MWLGFLCSASAPTLCGDVVSITSQHPPVPTAEGTEVVEDSNGKTFTVSSRVEFRVTKEDNDAEVTCTVDHESLQNSERSTTQKLQVHCTWCEGTGGHLGKGRGPKRGGRGGGGPRSHRMWPCVRTNVGPMWGDAV